MEVSSENLANLVKLKNLSLGDFSVVLKTAEFYPLVSADDFIERLESEIRAKESEI